MEAKDYNKKLDQGRKELMQNIQNDIRKASSLLAMAKGTLEDTITINQEYFYKNDSTHFDQIEIEDAFEVIDSIEGDLDTLCEKLENEK